LRKATEVVKLQHRAAVAATAIQRSKTHARGFSSSCYGNVTGIRADCSLHSVETESLPGKLHRKLHPIIHSRYFFTLV